MGDPWAAIGLRATEAAGDGVAVGGGRVPANCPCCVRALVRGASVTFGSVGVRVPSGCRRFRDGRMAGGSEGNGSRRWRRGKFTTRRLGSEAGRGISSGTRMIAVRGGAPFPRDGGRVGEVPERSRRHRYVTADTSLLGSDPRGSGPGGGGDCRAHSPCAGTWRPEGHPAGPGPP